MKVYEISVKGTPSWNRETWLVISESAKAAIEKAESRLKRAPRRYEGFSVESCQIISGDLIR